MSPLSELIDRLERAEDFDRELDRDIGEALLGWKVTSAYIETDEPAVYPNHPGAMYPTFTESVDAAIALTEKVLPGWAVHGLGKSPLHGLWWCQLYSLDARKSVEVEEIATPAGALVIATLRALQALKNIDGSAP